MKSSIKIDFTDRGNGMEPVIKVKLVKDTDDTRDSLLQAFFESLQHKSRWAQIVFEGDGVLPVDHPNIMPYEKCTNVSVFPVKPKEFLEMFKELFNALEQTDELEGELIRMAAQVSRNTTPATTG